MPQPIDGLFLTCNSNRIASAVTPALPAQRGERGCVATRSEVAAGQLALVSSSATAEMMSASRRGRLPRCRHRVIPAAAVAALARLASAVRVGGGSHQETTSTSTRSAESGSSRASTMSEGTAQRDANVAAADAVSSESFSSASALVAPPTFKYREAKEAALRDAAVRNAGRARKSLEFILTALFEVKEASFTAHEKEKAAFDRKQKRCDVKVPKLQGELRASENEAAGLRRQLENGEKRISKWENFLEAVNGKLTAQNQAIEQAERDLAAAVRQAGSEERERKHVLSELLRAEELLRSGSAAGTESAREIMQGLKLPFGEKGEKVQGFLADAERDLETARSDKGKAQKEKEASVVREKQILAALQEKKDAGLTNVNRLQEEVAGRKDDIRMAEQALERATKNLEDQEVLCGVSKYEWEQSMRQFAQEMKDFFFAEKMLGKQEDSVRSFLSLEETAAKELAVDKAEAAEEFGGTKTSNAVGPSQVTAGTPKAASQKEVAIAGAPQPTALLSSAASNFGKRISSGTGTALGDYFSTHDVSQWLLRGAEAQAPPAEVVSRPAPAAQPAAAAHPTTSSPGSGRVGAAAVGGLLLSEHAMLDRAFDIVDSVVNGPLDNPAPLFGGSVIPGTTIALGAQQAGTGTPPALAAALPTSFVQVQQGASLHLQASSLKQLAGANPSLRRLAAGVLEALSSASAASVLAEVKSPSPFHAGGESLVDTLLSPDDEESRMTAAALDKSTASAVSENSSDEQDDIADAPYQKMQAALPSAEMLQTALNGGPFDKVKRMLSDMISKVKTEMAAAQSKKEMCTSEAAKSRKQRLKLHKTLQDVEAQLSNVEKGLSENTDQQTGNRALVAEAEAAVQEVSGSRAADKEIADGLMKAGKNQLAKLDTVVRSLRELYESTVREIHAAKAAREVEEADGEDAARARRADVGLANFGDASEGTVGLGAEVPTFAAAMHLADGVPVPGEKATVEQSVQPESVAEVGGRAKPGRTPTQSNKMNLPALSGGNMQETVRTTPPATVKGAAAMPTTIPVSAPSPAVEIENPRPPAQITAAPAPSINTMRLLPLLPVSAPQAVNTANPDFEQDLQALLDSSSHLLTATGGRKQTQTPPAVPAAPIFLQLISATSSASSSSAAVLNEKIQDEMRSEEAELEELDEEQSQSLRAARSSELLNFNSASSSLVSPVTVDSWRRALALVEKVAENQMLKLFVVRGADLRDRAIFEKFVAEQNLAKAEVQKANAFLLRRMEKQKTLLGNLKTDHEEKLKELEFVEKYALELKSSCSGPSAEDMKKKREKEIEGLKDALMILAGEEA